MIQRPRRLVAIAAAIALAVAACTGDGGGTSGGASPSEGVPSPAASASASPGASTGPSASAPASASPGAEAGTFTNPVIDANFADPFILETEGAYYAYATGNLTWNIQVTRSEDLITWESTKEALPKLPLWQPIAKGKTWAPEVIQTDAGYVMHFTTRDVQAGKQCLSVATADAPEGPFVDTSEEPLLCQVDLGGSIDSSPFRDEDGSLWLTWKNDGNCCNMPTRLFIAPLDDTATKLTGDPVDLGLGTDRAWEGGVIEAPEIVRHEDTYYLFYSANGYDSDRYAIGYATSDSLEGPYTDAEENPIVETAGEAAGPGHSTVFEDDDGELWMAYHAWDPEQVGDISGGRRALWIDPLTFEDGKAVVQGPTSEPQPVP